MAHLSCTDHKRRVSFSWNGEFDLANVPGNVLVLHKNGDGTSCDSKRFSYGGDILDRFYLPFDERVNKGENW